MSARRESWVERAEAALERGSGGEDVEVVSKSSAPLLDAVGVRAVLSPLLAAFMWTAAVLREEMVAHPLDPIALLLRLLAFGLTVRALLLGATWLRRVGAALQRGRYHLVLTEDGLLLRTPETDYAVARDHVVAVTERGDWRNRRTSRRWSEVYIVTDPASGRLYLPVPPFFDRTPGALAERLMRWRGVVEPPEEPQHAEPHKLASKLYDEVAAGKRPPGVAVIRHGKGWLTRGPYASLLLGVALADGYLRLPAPARAQIGPMPPLLILVSLALVPLSWVWLTRRHVRPRKGLALVLTPAEMLMRTLSGIHRVRWKNLEAVRIEARKTWSLLEGAHEARTLLILRKGQPEIRYDEAFLGLPAEVAVALCNAYKDGRLPGEDMPAANLRASW